MGAMLMTQGIVFSFTILYSLVVCCFCNLEGIPRLDLALRPRNPLPTIVILQMEPIQPFLVNCFFFRSSLLHVEPHDFGFMAKRGHRDIFVSVVCHLHCRMHVLVISLHVFLFVLLQHGTVRTKESW